MVIATLAISSAQAMRPLFNTITSTTEIISSVELGVYQDSGCTQKLTSIDWGDINPGGNVTLTSYLCNLGNVNITLLMETVNWNPLTASNYMALSWDFTGQVIGPSAIVQVTFLLVISPDIMDIQSFSFDIVLTSQELAS